MSIKLTTTHTKHRPIYIYTCTYRQKPLKLLKIKKGPIDKTFHKTSGFDSWQKIVVVVDSCRKSLGFNRKEFQYCDWLTYTDSILLCLHAVGGSLLGAMAEAVEQAAVVLVCFSEKYKDSPNCRTGYSIMLIFIIPKAQRRRTVDVAEM